MRRQDAYGENCVGTIFKDHVKEGITTIFRIPGGVEAVQCNLVGDTRRAELCTHALTILRNSKNKF